jgi:hypothetical protein
VWPAWPKQEERGIILVPQKGLDEDNMPDMTVAGGTPRAVLFTPPSLVPVVDGAIVDRNKLRRVTITDGKAPPGAMPVTLKIEEIEGQHGLVVISVFGKDAGDRDNDVGERVHRPHGKPDRQPPARRRHPITRHCGFVFPTRRWCGILLSVLMGFRTTVLGRTME